ncbi:SdpI family protein [Streptomyces sp. NPDC020096]
MNAHLAVGLAVTAIYAAVIVLVLVLSGKSRNGTLHRNSLAGIRTEATQSSDTAWRDGQREGRRRYLLLIPVLAIAAVGSLINSFVGGPFWVFLAIAVACGSADVAIAATSTAAANRAARSAQHPNA